MLAALVLFNALDAIPLELIRRVVQNTMLRVVALYSFWAWWKKSFLDPIGHLSATNSGGLKASGFSVWRRTSHCGCALPLHRTRLIGGVISTLLFQWRRIAIVVPCFAKLVLALKVVNNFLKRHLSAQCTVFADGCNLQL
ncbi:MAG: hypothetical protein IPN27_12475 [Cellvibrionales bacterium]|nr:hypothetical protein [Cellvibrionales bacterium]